MPPQLLGNSGGSSGVPSVDVDDVPPAVKVEEAAEGDLLARLQTVEGELLELRALKERLAALEEVVLRELPERIVPVVPSPRPTRTSSIKKDHVGQSPTSETGDSAFMALQLEGQQLAEEDKQDAQGDPLAIEEVPLEGTVWDCVFLVGMVGTNGYVLSAVQTAAVLLLAFLNVCLQCICIWGISTTMAVSPLNSTVLESLLNQRLMENHHVDNIDPTSVTAKADLLCAEGVYNRMAGLQADVQDYLNSSLAGFYAGEAVSSIAMIIWILNITAEVQRIFRLTKTIWTLRHRRFHPSEQEHLHDLVVSEKGDGYDIVRMSMVRKICLSMFVLLPRLVLAVLLLFYGLRWLADTVAVSDLILNACALDIVSKIDDALFSAVLVSAVKVDRFKFEPKSSHRSGAALARAAKQAALIVAPCVFIMGFYHLVRWDSLATFVKQVEIAERYACQEDTKFVYGSHGVMGLPFFADLSTGEDGESGEEISISRQLQCVYAASRDLIAVRAGFEPRWMSDDQTIRDQILSKHDSCMQNGGNVYCPTISLAEINTIGSLTEDSYLSFDSRFCVDQVVHMSALSQVCTHADYRNALTSTVFAGRTQCADFADICTCPSKNHQGLCAANSSSYDDVIAEYNVTFTWIQALQNICPVSCEMCQDALVMPGQGTQTGLPPSGEAPGLPPSGEATGLPPSGEAPSGSPGEQAGGTGSPGATTGTGTGLNSQSPAPSGSPSGGQEDGDGPSGDPSSGQGGDGDSTNSQSPAPSGDPSDGQDDSDGDGDSPGSQSPAPSGSPSGDPSNGQDDSDGDGVSPGSQSPAPSGSPSGDSSDGPSSPGSGPPR